MSIALCGAALLLTTAARAAVEYTARLDWAKGSVQVDACVERATERLRLDAQPGAKTYLSRVWRDDPHPVRQIGDSLHTGPLAAGACVHYRVDVARASAERSHRFTGGRNTRVWVLSPGLWLWRDAQAGELQLELSPAVGASLPWRPITGRNNRYQLEAGGGDWPAFSVFGALDERIVTAADGSSLRITLIDPPSAARSELLHRWLGEVAAAAATAFGRFPVPGAQILVFSIDANSDSPVPWGQTTRGGAPSVQLFVRNDANLGELRADWTAIHEFSHLFHPYLGEQGRWLAEGLASYYQNVLRARAGLMSESDAWRRLDAGFARGRADAPGRSLRSLGDGRRDWRSGTMRVYWGGAAFWLEADIALRRRHGYGLDAVLGRYARCCLPVNGTIAPLAFLARLDALAGGDLLVPLARRYLDAPDFPDLDPAYATLGLHREQGKVEIGGEPSTAGLRRAIMRRDPATAAGDD